MKKTYLDFIDRYELSCTEEYYLHRKGSEEYPACRRLHVKAEEVDEWEEIPIADIPPYTKAQYRALVVELIRKRYDVDKEFEIQRELLDALLNPQPMTLDATDTEATASTPGIIADFNAYNTYVEECKLRAKEMLEKYPLQEDYGGL